MTTISPGLRAEDILESLTRVIDAEYGINIIDLGLVYGIEVAEGVVTVQMTLTEPDVPHRDDLIASIHDTLRRRHAEVDEVIVDMVADPPWRPDFITEAGEMQLRHPVQPGTADEEITPDDVVKSLKLVLDPEVGINIVDLGLIYVVTVRGQDVHIEMTLTTPGCPLHATIEQAVHRVLETRHPSVGEIEVELVWEPAWDVDKITPEGRAELGW